MEKNYLKSNNGITLVALVITIIVLLILAGVAISTLSGRDNIITKAQEARTNYNTSSEDEENKLNEYRDELEKLTKDDDNTDEIIGKYTLGDEVLTFGKGGVFSIAKSEAHEASSGSYTVSENNITVHLDSLYMHEEGGSEGYIYNVTDYFTFAKENGVATVTQIGQTWFGAEDNTQPGSLSSEELEGAIFTKIG